MSHDPYTTTEPPYDPKNLPEYLSRELRLIEAALSYLDLSVTNKWEKLSIPSTSMLTSGDTFDKPEIVSLSGNLGVYALSASVDSSLYFTLTMPSAYKEGSALKPIIRWAVTATASSTNNAVVWGFEYAMLNQSATLGTAVSIETTATAGAILQHLPSSLSDITATAATTNTVLVGRLYRRGTCDADNYAHRAFILSLDINYQRDAGGSLHESLK